MVDVGQNERRWTNLNNVFFHCIQEVDRDWMLKEKDDLIAEIRRDILMKTQALETIAAECYCDDVQEKNCMAKTMDRLKKDNNPR